MRQVLAIVLGLIALGQRAAGQSPKVISDCTVMFKVEAQASKADSQLVKALKATTRIVYIKGSKSRSDLITPNFKQVSIFDDRSDTAVVLREVGNAKYITYLNEAKRNEQNKKYQGIEFKYTDEKKTILGYDCNKAIATLPNGSSFNVYYCPSIVPSNREFDLQFKELPGFVLEYEAESESGRAKITYAASQITLLPVPGAMFDTPKTGYRVL